LSTWLDKEDQEQAEQEMKLGYKRDHQGLLSPIEIEIFDGNVEAYPGIPLIPTDEIITLRGWPDEGRARVYVTTGGVEVIVPINHLSQEKS